MAIVVPREQTPNPFIPGFQSLADQLVSNYQNKQRTRVINDLLTQRNQMNSTAVGQALQSGAQPQLSADDIAIELTRRGINPSQFAPVLQALKSQDQRQRNEAALTEIAGKPDDFATLLLQGGQLDSGTQGLLNNLLRNRTTMLANANKPVALSAAEKEMVKYDVKAVSGWQSSAAQATNLLNSVQSIQPLLQTNVLGSFLGSWGQKNPGEVDKFNDAVTRYKLSQHGTQYTQKEYENTYESNKLDVSKGAAFNEKRLAALQADLRSDQFKAYISHQLEQNEGMIKPGHATRVNQLYQQAVSKSRDPDEQDQFIREQLDPVVRAQRAQDLKGEQGISDTIGPVKPQLPAKAPETPAVGTSAPPAPNRAPVAQSAPQAPQNGDSSLVGSFINNPLTRLAALPAADATMALTAPEDFALGGLGLAARGVQRLAGISAEDAERMEQAQLAKAYERLELGAQDPAIAAAFDYDYGGDDLVPNVDWTKLQGLGGLVKQGLNKLTGGYFEPKNNTEKVVQKAGAFFGGGARLRGLGETAQMGAKEVGKEAFRDLGSAYGSEVGEEIGRNLGGESEVGKAIGGAAGGLLGLFPGRGAASLALDPKSAPKKAGDFFGTIGGLRSKWRKGADTEKVSKIIETAAAEDIPLSAAQVTKSRFARAAENFGGQTFAGEAAQRERTRVQEAFQSSLEDILGGVSKDVVGSANAAGGEVVFQSGLTSEALKTDAKALYNKVTDALSGTKNFNFTPYKTQKMIGELRKQFNKVSGPSRKIVKEQLDNLSTRLEKTGQLEAHWVGNHLKDLNDMAGQPSAIGDTLDLLQGLRGALAEDLRMGAQRNGNAEVANALSRANKLTETRHILFGDTATGRSLLNENNPEGILTNFNSLSKLKTMRKAVLAGSKGEETWGMLCREYLEQLLGKGSADGKYNLNALADITQKRGMKPILQEILGSKAYTRLRNIGDVANHARTINRELLNPSQTAQTSEIVKGAKMGLGALFTGLAGTGLTVAKLLTMAKSAFTYAGIKGAAELVQNPKFKSALVSTYDAVQKGRKLDLKGFENLVQGLVKTQAAKDRKTDEGKKAA